MLREKIAIFLLFFLPASTTSAQSGVRPSQNRSDAPASLTIPAGTSAKVELQSPISSKLNEAGDEVSAILDNSIIVDGYVALKRGTEIRGRITQITAAQRPQRQASMTIVFDKLVAPDGEMEIETRIKSIDDYANEDKLNADDEGKVKGGRSGGKTVDNTIKGGTLGTIVGLPIILTAGTVGVAAPLGGALGGVLLTKGKEIKLQRGTLFRIEIAKPIAVPFGDSVKDPLRSTERPTRTQVYDEDRQL